MNLGESLRLARKKANLKQIEVAELSGLSQAYLSQVEKGKKEPSMDALRGLCRVIGVPVPILFWSMLEEGDVPEKKQEAFRIVKPSIDALIDQVLYK